MERKRARLAEMGRSSFVSKSGMDALLTEYLSIPPDELPAHFSRSVISRACLEVSSITTSYGQVMTTESLRLMDGDMHEVTYPSPMPLLEHLLAECYPLEYEFRLAHRRHPSSIAEPWRIALYSDEVLPGNQLKSLNHRKAQAIYWTLCELEGLGNENLWFVWTVVRSEVVNMLEVG